MISNVKTRQWLYLVTGLVAAVVPILVQTGLLDSGQGDSSATLITSLVALLGGGGALTAAHHTRIQIKDGVHDPGAVADGSDSGGDPSGDVPGG